MLDWFKKLFKKKEPPAPQKADLRCPYCWPSMNKKWKTVYQSAWGYAPFDYFCLICQREMEDEEVIPFNFKVEDGQIR
jgi:hypothetical protein